MAQQRISPYDGRVLQDFTIISSHDINLHPVPYDAMEIAATDANGQPLKIDYYQLTQSGSYTASFATFSGSVSFKKVSSSYFSYSGSAMTNTYAVRLV